VLKVQVQKLREALQLLEPAVPRKPSVPALMNVRLGEGKAVATDLEVAITISGVGEDGAGEGVCLDYRTLLKLLASVPGYEMATITLEDKKATLTAGATRAVLAALPVADYPTIPELKPEHEAAVDGDALVRALAAVLPCAAVGDTRPVLNTVCLTLGDSPEAAGADGFRLGWQPLPFKLPGEGALLIPTHTVGALLHLWKKAPKPPELEGMLDPARVATAKRLVRLQYSKDRLAVSFGQVSLITVLTQGTFPNYRQLIPAEGTSSVSFLAPDLERAARVVLPVAKEGSGIIRLSWAEKELRVEGRAEDLGTTTTVISAVCQGEGRIAFNYLYLLEYLKGKEGLVTLEGTGPSAPAKFSYRGTPHLVMMPMFIKGEGEATPAQATAAEEPGEEEVEPEAPEPPPTAPETPSAAAGPEKARARRKKAKK